MTSAPTVLGLNPDHCLHFNVPVPHHPEHPQRIVEIRKRLEECGLLAKCKVIEEDVPALCFNLLHQVHAHEHVDDLRQLEQKEQEAIDEFTTKYDSVNCTKDSLSTALTAAACAVHLTRLVIKGEATNAFALVRPPGHHAQRSLANGFCLLNNVALAAQEALNEGLERVLIVDFDVHHGQGTQYAFYNNPKVLYFSVHRYGHGTFWPNLPQSEFTFIGEGEGEGFNVNFPLNETKVGDEDYMFIFRKILQPISAEWKPELILYSAGFDACAGDTVGQMWATPDLYANWIHHLRGVCSKQVLVLEGGYHHKMQAFCVQRCVETLLGGVPPDVSGKEVRPTVLETAANLQHLLAKHWKSLGEPVDADFVPKTNYTPPPRVRVNTHNVFQEKLELPFDVAQYDQPLPNPSAKGH